MLHYSEYCSFKCLHFMKYYYILTLVPQCWSVQICLLMLNATWSAPIVLLLLHAFTALGWGVPPSHPCSSSPNAIREKNNHWQHWQVRAGEQEHEYSHVSEREQEEEEQTDVSVCLIVALILWQWHTVNSNSESLRPPGPEIPRNQLTFAQRHIDAALRRDRDSTESHICIHRGRPPARCLCKWYRMSALTGI